MSSSPEPLPKKRRRSTPSVQTAKKRELDRIAQKKSRDRARNRVTELEEKITRLQSHDKAKQIADLMQTVEELRGENERLRNVTDKIKCLTESAGERKDFEAGQSSGIPISNTKKEVTGPPSPESNPSVNSPEVDILPQDRWWSESPSSPTTELLPTDEPDPIEALIAYVAPETTSRTYSGHHGSTIFSLAPTYDFMPFTTPTLRHSHRHSLHSHSASLSLGTPNLLHLPQSLTVVPDHAKWTTSNDAFVFGITRSLASSKTSPTQRIPEVIADSHAAYKAILWGKNRLEREGEGGDGEKERGHPLWAALRQVDERVFGEWNRKAQRVAMMFVCQRVLLYKCNPCKETLERVPSFLRPRPSQETLQHPAVIDFLIWPGLRDRLVFSHKRYTSTGSFSAAFCRYLRFHWPYGEDEILTFQEGKGWRISALFEKYASDLENWTMDEGFFEEYQEMRFDIPCSEKRRERGSAVGEASWEEEVWNFMPMTA